MSTPAQPWPDDEYAAAAAAIGRTCALLLVTEERWVHRRVETVDLLSTELVRRSTSVDLTVPEPLRPFLVVNGSQSLVPIATLSKGRVRNFDLRDEGGRAVPVVGRDHNSGIAHQALMGVADFTADAAGVGPLTVRTTADLHAVATSADSDESLHTLECMRRAAENGDHQLRALLQDDWIAFLLLQLASNYILLAVVDDLDRRRVFKFGYDEQLEERRPMRQRLAEGAGFTPLVFTIDVPAAGRTASYHTEIVIPEELRIEVAVLYDEEDLTIHAVDQNADRGAVHAPDVDTSARAMLVVFLRAQREGLPTTAFAVSVVTALLLATGAWLVDLPAGASQSMSTGPPISVLLAAQALFVGAIAQRGEHRLVRRLFVLSRTLLIVTALSALAAAGVLAFNQSAEAVDRVWKIAAVVTVAATSILGFGWLRAVSPNRRRRDRGVQ